MGNTDLMRDDNPTRGLPIVSPANMIPVQVIHREVVAPGVVTVYIVLPGAQQAPAPYLPGQFVTLALPTPRETLYRSYSLCGDGDDSQPWSLTIKRLEQGAVSTYFYNLVNAGTLLYASLPRGTFTLPARLGPEMCVVMVAVGSGITPIMGMLRALDRMPPEERPLVQLHYGSRSADEIIFGEELDAMDRDGSWLRQYHYLSSKGNRMTADTVIGRAGTPGKSANWYMCGPENLKRDIQKQLRALGVPERHVHSEVFATSSGPAYKIEARGGQGVGGSLRVADTGAELDVEPQETLLTALERHGYRPEFSCRAGSCGACKLRVLDGQVDPVGEALSSDERTAGYVLSCIARPIGAVTLASGGKPPAGTVRRALAALDGLPAVRGRAVGRTRLVALVGASALLLGSWNLTNHRPNSWNVANAAAGPNQPAVTITLPASTATTSHSGGSGGGAKPTATPSGSGGGGTGGGGTGGGGAKPTATPSGGGGGGGGAPAPTATPAPQPTPVPAATSTPS